MHVMNNPPPDARTSTEKMSDALDTLLGVTDREKELFSTFLLTGFREQEVAFLFWSDVNLKLRTIRVTSKPHDE